MHCTGNERLAHTLANALAAASSLIEEDPERARALLADISAYLAHELCATQVPIDREIEQVHRYARLHEARFERPLAIDFENPESRPDRVAPGLLTEQVEQAVASVRAAGGVVDRVRVRFGLGEGAGRALAIAGPWGPQP